MTSIRQTSKKVLNILYNHYTAQNPIDSISLEELFHRLGTEFSAKVIKAALNYLTDKEFITPISQNKSQILSYKLTPKGIDFHESEEEAFHIKGNGPLITFQGDMKGQLHLNSYGSYGEDHSNSSQSIYSDKEIDQQSEIMLDFIDWVRGLIDENISSDLKEEIEVKCDMLETLIRSEEFPPLRD